MLPMQKLDWVDDFSTRFCEYNEMTNFKSSKFHGSLTINFCDGVAANCNISIYRKANTNNGVPKIRLTS